MRSKPIDPEPIERVGIFPPRVWYTPPHSLTHNLPDVDADPGTYPYPDGCTVIRHADGYSDFIPYTDTDAGPYGGNDSRPDIEANL